MTPRHERSPSAGTRDPAQALLHEPQHIRDLCLSLLARGESLDRCLGRLLGRVCETLPGSDALVLGIDSGGLVDAVHTCGELDLSVVDELRGNGLADALTARSRAAHVVGPVTVADAVEPDPRHAPLAQLCLRLDRRSSWSYFVSSESGEPLGAFVLLRRAAGAPAAEEQRLLLAAASCVGAVLKVDLLRRERDEQRGHVDSLLSTTNIVLISVDVNGCVLRANSACRRLVESMTDLIGRRLEDTPLFASDPGECRALLARDVGDRRVVNFETRVDSGPWNPERPARLSWCCAPLASREGRGTGWVCAGLDVTELRSAEVEKARLERELIEVQRMEAVGELTSGIAHDFNNMLMAILGFSDLARADLPDDHPARAALDQVEAASLRAAGVSKALLTFSRRTAFERGIVDLGEVLTSSVGMLRRIFPRSLEIVEHCEEREPVLVWGDENQLRQVIVNLAVNAREAMDGQGTLTCALRVEHGRGDDVRASGDVIALEVADDGPGMTPEVRERLFEMGFSTKGRRGGTGLGLPVLRDIVRDHGGWVEVDTAPGRGSSFVVRFPRWAHRRPAPERIRGSSGSGELVLVAEDDPMVASTLRSGLEQAGFDVRVVQDGLEFVLEALDLEERVGHLIVDLDLPSMDGLEALRELRAAGISCPAMITSAWSEIDGSAASELGAEFLRKPFRMRELISRIAANLGRSNG